MKLSEKTSAAAKSSGLNEVAQRAGVSTATVSRVLNGRTGVSEEARRRTMSAVEALGYQPDARLSRFFSTVRGGTKILAFLATPNLYGLMVAQDGFYSRHLIGVQEEVRRRNYHLLLADGVQDVNEEGCARCVAEGKVDGVIAEGFDAATIAAMSQRVPVVVLNREAEEAEADVVLPHVERAAYRQMAHLVEQGHRAVACFKPRPGSWQDGRYWTAYTRLCEKFGLPLPVAYLQPIDFESGGDEAVVAAYVGRVLQCEAPPTAILTYDCYVEHLIGALAQRGLTVPRDISIVGYDDFSPGLRSSIPITTFRQNFEEMGRIAVELLLERIKEPERATRLVEVDGTLLLRQSSGPAPVR